MLAWKVQPTRKLCLNYIGPRVDDEDETQCLFFDRYVDYVMSSQSRLRHLAGFTFILSSVSGLLPAQDRVTVATNSNHSLLSPINGENAVLFQLDPLPNAVRCPVVTAMAVDEQSETMAAAGDDHAIRWIDLKTGKVLAVLLGHEDWVKQLKFVPTSNKALKLVSCGDDGKLFAWAWSIEENTPTVERSTVLSCDHTLTSLAVSSDGSQYATGGFSHNIYLGTFQTQQPKKQVDCNCGDQRALVFSRDNETLFVGGRDGMVHVISVAEAKIITEYKAHHGRLRALSIDQSGKVLTSVGEDRFVQSREWQTGETLLSLKLNAGKLLAVEPIDDRRFAIASADNTVQIIDSRTGEEINKLVGHDGSVAVLLYQHDRLFTSGFDTTIRVWDLHREHSTDRTTKLIRHPIQGRFFDSGVSDSTN